MLVLMPGVRPDVSINVRHMTEFFQGEGHMTLLLMSGVGHMLVLMSGIRTHVSI